MQEKFAPSAFRASKAPALPDYAVMVRAAPEIVARLHNPGRFARVVQRYPPDADGWVKLEMQLDVEENACEYLLGFGAQVQVVAPQTLREKIDVQHGWNPGDRLSA